MKDRFTIQLFFAIVVLFAVSLIVACQPKLERCSDDDPSCNPAHPANQEHSANTNAPLMKPVESPVENVAPKVAEQPSHLGLTGEEQVLSQYRNNYMIGAGDRSSDYLRKYKDGQKVFVLAPSMENCRQIEKEVDGGRAGSIAKTFDCSVVFGTMLTELSQVCEIAEIESVSAAFFVGEYGRYPAAGADATTALVVRVSACVEPDKR